MSTAAEADRDLALVRAVFKAAKTTSAFGLEHQVTRAAAERLRAAIEGIGVPFALQLVADAAYVDRQLVSVPPGEYSSVHTLLRLFDNLGHHELQFDRVPSPREILQLVAVLAEGLVAPSTSAEDTPIPGISWTVIPNAGFGIDSESVDEELFAVTQLALAIADIERAETTYLSEGTWHWTAGLSAVRRLERGLATDRNAMLRALELSPGPWSAARRAVSVGRCVQQALHTVGTPAVLVRAAGHAAIAVATAAFVATTTVDIAAEQLLALLQDTGLETTPHRLRVVTVVRCLAQTSSDDLTSVVELITAAHELERLRVVARPGHIAPRVDLLALGLERFTTPWIKLIINMEGLLPPGARVVLPDSRGAIVLGVGDPLNPWRPLVLVEGEAIIAEGPVRFA